MALGGYQDPGWWSSIRHMLTLGFVKPPVVDGVVMTRNLFLSLFYAAFAMLLVLSRIMPVGSPSPAIGALVVTLGVAGATGSFFMSRRALDASTPKNLAGSYRSLFFLGFATAEAPLLIALAICFVHDRFWPYLVALPLFLLGMSFIAPTRSNIERRERELTATGSMLSLVDALNAPSSDASSREPT